MYVVVFVTDGINIMRTHFVKEGFSEDSVVVAGGEVTGVEWVTELAGVITGDLSPVLPEGGPPLTKCHLFVSHTLPRGPWVLEMLKLPHPLSFGILHNCLEFKSSYLHQHRPSPLE